MLNRLELQIKRKKVVSNYSKIYEQQGKTGLRLNRNRGLQVIITSRGTTGI
jgi:hypothetical protein